MSKTRTRSRRSGSGGYVANSYRTQGIVLRTYKLAEADRIIIMLTRDAGQVRAVARGVRRTTSKFGASLEPFTHTGAQIARGRNLDIISQTQTLNAYGPALAADYDRFTTASAMVEAAERLTRDEDHRVARRQFLLLHAAVDSLAKGEHSPRMTLVSYLLRALSTAGWAPTFEVCAQCGAEGPHSNVSVPMGGAVCWECRPSGAQNIGREAMGVLAALLRGNWEHVETASESTHRTAHRIAEEYLQYHVERYLHSLVVLDQSDPNGTSR